MANKNLNAAKVAKKDEFYTQLSDIERELQHYWQHFKGKTILCNCDDPYESNFFKYFASNFNFFGLKKLIATCYCGSPVSGTQLSLDDIVNLKIDNKKAYKIEISEVIDANNDGAIDISDVTYLIKNKKNVLTLLNQDGDFRSSECIELLKQSDIVITNPPFSLFREYVAQLIEYDKKFVIIGNDNCRTYKEIFPLIKNNQIWCGYNHVKEFCKSDGTIQKFGNVSWYTNLPITKRNEELILYKRYYLTDADKNNPNYTNPDYPKYDNYDAINVDKVSDIPIDYDGVMGVPITFLDKYTPKQFDIIKFRKGDDNRDLEYTKNGRNLEREREFLQSQNTTILQDTHSSSSELTDTQKEIQHQAKECVSTERNNMFEYLSNEFEILDCNDFRRNDCVPVKNYGLIKDKEGAINGKPKYVRILIRRK